MCRDWSEVGVVCTLVPWLVLLGLGGLPCAFSAKQKWK